MSVAVRTSQNVLLEYEPASLGERILAAIVDYLVIFGWVILVISVPAQLHLPTGNVYVICVLFPIIVYDLLSEWLLNGRSVGKIALGIRVVMLDGSQPGQGAYLIRWLFRIIESAAFLGGIIPIIAVAVNGKGQRLGDIAAGTTVVKLKQAVSLDEVLLRPFDENYVVQFPDVRLLIDRDISIIQEALRIGDESILMRTAQKVKDVTGISSQLTNRVFLETIVADYQFITVQ